MRISCTYSCLCKTDSYWVKQYAIFQQNASSRPRDCARTGTYRYSIHDFRNTPGQRKPLPTCQISARCVQPFPRYGKVARTCARSDVPNPWFKKAPGYLVFSQSNFSAIRPAVHEIRERGTHLRTCSRCTPPLACVKRLANWSLITHLFQRSPSGYPRDTKHWGDFARSHVCTYRCTSPIICGMCIATWSLATIWCHSWPSHS